MKQPRRICRLARRTQTHSPGRVLAVVVPIAILGFAAYLWSKNLESKAHGDMAATVVGRMFISEPMPAGASMEYADADHDMVADPPSDPSKMLNPDVLVFSYVAGPEDETPPDDTWKELTDAIKKKTGKEVKVARFKTPEDQLAALKNGELHVAGLNTGLVQQAVEHAGFVPFCTLGRADGTWGYTMEFLVPAGSPIKKLEDIKGHKVTFTQLDSNSGCKAPLVLLKEHGLIPERDYTVAFSQGHKDSIKGVAAKDVEVAPVASDILAQMIEKKEIDKAAVVTIYKSEHFPRGDDRLCVQLVSRAA